MNTWVWTQQSVCYPHLLHLRTLGGLVWFLCNVYLRTSTPVKTTGDYNTPHSKELWHSRDSPSFKICSVQQNHTVGLLRLRGPQSSLLPSPSPFSPTIHSAIQVNDHGVTGPSLFLTPTPSHQIPLRPPSKLLYNPSRPLDSATRT